MLIINKNYKDDSDRVYLIKGDHSITVRVIDKIGYVNAEDIEFEV